MWKYIVTWTIFVQIQCPQPSKDNCIEVKTMAKKFINKEKAILFHDVGNYNSPLSMTIDSVFIKIQIDE